MGMFEYIAVLTSIIVGLGITHLLKGVARFVQHPGRVQMYWVHLVWVLYMFFTIIFWWWWEFRFIEVENWTFQLYLFLLSFALFLFLLCALLFPSDLEGYDGFKDYFFSRRAWFFGLLALFFVIDLADTWFKGSEYFHSLGLEYVVASIVQPIAYVVAMFLRNERFHGGLAVLSLAYQLSLATRFYQTVG
jgi:hypothetical protein